MENKIIQQSDLPITLESDTHYIIGHDLEWNDYENAAILINGHNIHIDGCNNKILLGKGKQYYINTYTSSFTKLSEEIIEDYPGEDHHNPNIMYENRYTASFNIKFIIDKNIDNINLKFKSDYETKNDISFRLYDPNGIYIMEQQSMIKNNEELYFSINQKSMGEYTIQILLNKIDIDKLSNDNDIIIDLSIIKNVIGISTNSSYIDKNDDKDLSIIKNINFLGNDYSQGIKLKNFNSFIKIINILYIKT
jgi:hypothetical protein